jgi:Pyruvate/2-oxoacid:ferredoxin oxidoreductase delta subunit
LPQFAIRAEACLPALYPASECSACADACPRQALVSDEDELAFDPDACSGCGACAAACPVLAITLEGQEAPAFIDRPAAAGWLLCPRHPAADSDALCVQALGLEALGRLWLAGLRRLTCVTADCATCADGAGADPAERIAELNRLLDSRALPELELRRAGQVSRNGPRIGPEETVRKAGRRRLFGLSATPNNGTIRPLSLIQDMPGDTALFAFAPLIDSQACTGCDACIRACPDTALSLIKDEAGEAAYTIAPSLCSGCGLCSDMCPAGAIQIGQIAAAPPPVALRLYRCRGCGVDVHEPAAQPAQDLCPVCRKTAHHKKLFQVIG